MTKKLSKLHPLSLTVTFGLGNMPFAPGTWGSLPAFPLAFLAFFYFGHTGYIVMALMIVGLFLLGLWAVKRYMTLTGTHDPREVVIDEVVGQLITLVIAAPVIGASDHGGMRGVLMLGGCFILFRIFDIFKPWPAGWADKELDGSLGVMLDDVFAGIQAGLVFWGVYYGINFLG